MQNLVPASSPSAVPESTKTLSPPTDHPLSRRSLSASWNAQIMLRRSIVEVSSRRPFRQLTSQIPAFLSSRKALSVVPENNTLGSTGKKPPESRSPFSKVLLGSVVGGAAVTAAYQFGYLDRFLGNDKLDSHLGAEDVPNSSEKIESPSTEEPDRVSTNCEGKLENESEAPSREASSERQPQGSPEGLDESVVAREEGKAPVEEKGVHDKSNAAFQGSHSSDASEPVTAQADAVAEEDGVASLLPRLAVDDEPEKTLSEDAEPITSLLDAYHVGENVDKHVSAEKLAQKAEAFASATEDNDGNLSKDGKFVVDFLQAIHIAEKRQAELDARVLAEEIRTLKEKYEKELKDAIAREFMRAEEAAILDKELKREIAKAAAAISSLQEKAEERLREELEQKESESQLKLEKLEELLKAELAAKIATEKAAQIEKLAEANLNINALCMAFYARSEEARQNHSAHKLALSALALDDALTKGLPIQAEIEALHTHLEGNDKEPIIDLVLASLPEEIRSHGTDTILQLNQKFDALKGTLRHFSLLPPDGGGILAHSLAHVASRLKVREVDQSGDGIESVISRVEKYLAEGKLVEAADVLEEGVRGSQAAEIVSAWVTQARNRAIAEQALTLLQSYATSISVSS